MARLRRLREKITTKLSAVTTTTAPVEQPSAGSSFEAVGRKQGWRIGTSGSLESVETVASEDRAKAVEMIASEERAKAMETVASEETAKVMETIASEETAKAASGAMSEALGALKEEKVYRRQSRFREEFGEDC